MYFGGPDQSKPIYRLVTYIVHRLQVCKLVLIELNTLPE